MQLLYNVIKSSSIKDTGHKNIVTDEEIRSAKVERESKIKNHMDSYESLAKSIIENARKQSEAILSKAYEEAGNLEEEASVKAKKAYEDGLKKGYKEGYEKGYEDTVQKAKEESDAIISSAEDMLKNADLEYEKYLQSKTYEINELIITIAESVLKREVKQKDAINEMIFNALENSKNAKTFIIRCSSIYADEIKAQITAWKEKLGFLGEIFVIKDDSIEKGNAVIDKGNGKIVVGIDYAVKKLREIFEGNE